LLEEETFTHDCGRKITRLVQPAGNDGLKLADLGSRLFRCTQPDIHGRQNPDFDPDFFLPVSRLPDDLPSASRERETTLHNLWVGEALSYFGIPDSARESAEDLGVVTVSYRVGDSERVAFQNLMARHKFDAPVADVALQFLLSFIRKIKAFTLPDGVNPDDPAFGRVRAVISFGEKADSKNNIRGWFESAKQDCRERFEAALKKITDELEALLEEYNKVLKNYGANAAVPIEDAITNLLRADVIAALALRGFLPRYAFIRCCGRRSRLRP
jgi:hypothetical protein